jgi:hypothetical protein
VKTAAEILISQKRHSDLRDLAEAILMFDALASIAFARRCQPKTNYRK